jgi:uncharacterized protein
LSHSVIAFVPTIHASRYLQQLCKHWSHKLSVEFSPVRGMVIFPGEANGANHPGDARVSFVALDIWLQLRIDGTCAEQTEQLKAVVERHLDRFAFREEPLLFYWR